MHATGTGAGDITEVQAVNTVFGKSANTYGNFTKGNIGKAMETTLDVQRDHVKLVRDAVALLEPDGVLVFSTNLRSFKLDAAALADLRIEDVTAGTIPPDFERNPRIHRCFVVRR